MGQNNTWNPAQLNQRINELEAKVKAADVEANPTGEATEALEKVSIDGNIYSIPTTAEDITYGEGTLDNFLDNLSDDNVKTKSIMAIAANEYTSFGLAFAEIKTAYDTLSDSEKEKAFIVINNQIYSNQNKSNGTFTLNTIGLSAVNLRSIYLNDGGSQYYLWAAVGTSSTSIVDHTSDAQNVAIELKI